MLVLSITAFANTSVNLQNFWIILRKRKRLSRRHYILALPCDFADGALPIRLPGSTVGGVFIDENNVITKVQIDGNYYKDIYPKNINEMLERYVGEKIAVTYD